MAIILLDAAAATGASEAVNVYGAKDHTVQCVDTGDATTIIVNLEGSLDGTTWFSLAEHTYSAGEITADAAMFHVVNKPTQWVRANLATLTAGSSPTVTVKYMPVEVSR